MTFMTDYSAWKIPASTILFLIGCGLHNRYTGYRKIVDANRMSRRDQNRDLENTNRAPVSPFCVISSYEYTQQLVNLNLALRSEPTKAGTEAMKSD